MYVDKLCNLLKQRMPFKPLPRKKMRVLSSNFEFDDKGRARKATNFVDYDVAENLKNLKVSDFSITALQAVGAQLNPVQLPMDNNTFVSDVTTKVNELINSNKTE